MSNRMEQETSDLVDAFEKEVKKNQIWKDSLEAKKELWQEFIKSSLNAPEAKRIRIKSRWPHILVLGEVVSGLGILIWSLLATEWIVNFSNPVSLVITLVMTGVMVSGLLILWHTDSLSRQHFNQKIKNFIASGKLEDGASDYLVPTKHTYINVVLLALGLFLMRPLNGLSGNGICSLAFLSMFAFGTVFIFLPEIKAKFLFHQNDLNSYFKTISDNPAIQSFLKTGARLTDDHSLETVQDPISLKTYSSEEIYKSQDLTKKQRKEFEEKLEPVVNTFEKVKFMLEADESEKIADCLNYIRTHPQKLPELTDLLKEISHTVNILEIGLTGWLQDNDTNDITLERTRLLKDQDIRLVTGIVRQSFAHVNQEAAKFNNIRKQSLKKRILLEKDRQEVSLQN